ncbi:molybdopterin synthase [Haloferax mediterranei ATCC 33500]|uniref:Bifunctional molybdopterin-guanine dinucleotide biosynthesis protein MobB/MoaE n=1 Tax=Haloferax mediterranei (strain ATCC 33500 / DSM 1411 / JCM 8866 / NBRC 14739 / NCIMB 2177 / R-4) TaxID=523841 RepID=I3R5Y2_HALMT|nr:molybdopterin synthase [Haloferax mediterranei]AFK19642.1 molybdopterin converting factor, large subunit [Haloferax mediterranei ATCC 33500]AHZ23029.1 bifunctional molybdopterin-guanine dinucleotide biosynthesis protein MobB/MoaE [Haloferax mediterranei ATCC 33500]ELZ99959.1 bifunctional molybdopterin-guanine dinucleotide biosynthesis protein MobB/MoaE [Haloferax mediterranei ATCC 33500]MDX5987619.1 molybdopterin synthase [Haloferax mediterranei ATCC 33500]QCQ74106.1 molybdopterin synthase 
MQVFGIVGAGATTLCERLAPQLDGRVATIESLPSGATEAETPESVSETDAVSVAYGLAPNGNWVGTGEGRDLDGLLDDLASQCDYALLSGFPDARVPTLALDGADAANVVAEAETAEAVDINDLAADVDSCEPHITLESLVDRVKADPLADYAGAIATFTGRVRAKENEDDERTVSLEFEKYDGVAETEMATISEELEARDGVHRVLMHHRVGVIEDGADIVFVVVLAGHRTEAFRTVEDGINRLKDEVPIFKKETTTEEEFWVHDR